MLPSQPTSGVIRIWRLARYVAAVVGLCALLIAGSIALGHRAFAAVAIRTQQRGDAIFLVDADHQLDFNLTPPSAIDGEPTLSPDGMLLAFHSTRAAPVGRMNEADIYLADLRTGRVRVLVAMPGLDNYPAWSPDGQTIAFRSDGYSGRWPIVIAADVQTGQVTRLYETVRGDHPFAWSPDGSRLAFTTYRNKAEIHLTTFPGRQRSKLIGDGKTNYVQPVWEDIGTLHVGAGDASNRLRVSLD